MRTKTTAIPTHRPAFESVEFDDASATSPTTTASAALVTVDDPVAAPTSCSGFASPELGGMSAEDPPAFVLDGLLLGELGAEAVGSSGSGARAGASAGNNERDGPMRGDGS